MQHNITLLLLLLLLTSCGLPQPFYNGKTIPHYINPYFDVYLAKFKRDAESRGIGTGDLESISYMHLNALQGNETGMCYYHTEDSPFYHNFYKEIVIDPSVLTASEDMQYEIILHELGHCAYHLSHSTNHNSIMYPIIKSNLSLLKSEDEFFIISKNNESNWYSETSIVN